MENFSKANGSATRLACFVSTVKTATSKVFRQQAGRMPRDCLASLCAI